MEADSAYCEQTEKVGLAAPESRRDEIAAEHVGVEREVALAGIEQHGAIDAVVDSGGGAARLDAHAAVRLLRRNWRQMLNLRRLREWR